jgi:hypothetical protein
MNRVLETLEAAATELPGAIGAGRFSRQQGHPGKIERLCSVHCGCLSFQLRDLLNESFDIKAIQNALVV